MALETIQTNRPRIDSADAALLIGASLVFDVISIVPGFNIASVVVAQTVIPFLFSRRGVNVFSAKKVAPYAIAWLIELFPALSALPALTLETLIIIYLSRREDGKKESLKAGKQES